MSTKHRLSLYYGIVGASGFLCFILAARSVEHWRVQEILALLPMYLLLSQLSVRLPSGMNMTPVYPFAAAAMVVLGPPHTIVIAVAPFLARVLLNREKPLFALYIVGQLSLTNFLAGTVYRLAGGEFGVLALPKGLPAFIAFALTFDFVNMGFTQGRLSLANGEPFLRGWWRRVAYDRGWAMPLYHALGLLSTLIYLDRGVFGLAVAILPLFGLHAFFTLYTQVAEARQLAMTDRLTGVGNYRALTDWLARSFDRVVAGDRPLSVLAMDVDGMKVTNDTYGHEAGNAVLQAVARTLEATTRHSDIVARYGGDEFVVLLVNTTAQEANVVHSRISETIAALKVEHDGHQIGVSLSIGLATHPHDAGTAEELLIAADKAMYEVKNRRRNSRERLASPVTAPLQIIQMTEC